MKRRTLVFLLTVVLLAAGLLLGIRMIRESERTLPDALCVAPSSENGLPCLLQLVQTGDEYTLYLPGNTDPADCRFFWEGGLRGYDGNRYCKSGDMPVPMPGETVTYSFRNRAGREQFTVTTLQGSKDVQPVFFEIDEREGTIAAMNGDPDHNAFCSGIVFIGGKEQVLTRIKGRGNWTWAVSTDKKSYNIVLGEKSAVPGLDAEETDKYCFLANVGDHSLLRNRAGYDLGYVLGIGNDSAPADVWMNGVYQGLYLVTPKTDAYVSDDGYLLENDVYAEPPVSEGGDPSFMLAGLYGSNGTDLFNNQDNRITVKKIGDNLLAGEDDLVVTDGIRTWMQEAWDAVRSPDGFNDKGKYYTEYIDLTSFAKMFLVLEYSKDYDVCCGSKYFQRFGTGDGDKLYAMPVWDLDNAFGTMSANRRLLLAEEVGLSTGYGEFFRNIRDLPTSIYRTLGRHADFMEEVCRVYREYQDVFDAVPEKIGAWSAEIEDSARMNFHKVDPLEHESLARYKKDTVRNAGTAYEQEYFATPDARTDWPVYIWNLRTFCTTRSRFLRDAMEDGCYAEVLPETPPQTFRFADVQDERKYYYAPVYWAAYHVPQIAAGTEDGKFEPDRPCTRGQAILFLYAAAGRPEGPDPESSFTDVPEGSIYAKAVFWAVQNGIAEGKEEGRFGAADDVTRAEFVTMLYRYAGSPPCDDSALPFADVPADAAWRRAAAWAVQEGIAAGRSGGRFDPDAVCTRAEIVTFLYRLMKEE